MPERRKTTAVSGRGRSSTTGRGTSLQKRKTEGRGGTLQKRKTEVGGDKYKLKTSKSARISSAAASGSRGRSSSARSTSKGLSRGSSGSSRVEANEMRRAKSALLEKKRSSRKSELKKQGSSVGKLIKSLSKRSGLLKSKTSSNVSGVAAHAVELLGLTQKDLDKLRARFDEADSDGSGEIEISEFFKLLNHEETAFTDALFALIDSDNSGTISFDEFVQVLTTYCIYSQDDILFFIFSYFDKDGSGTLEEAEFIEMCKNVNANPHFPGSVQRAFEGFDCNDDGLIDFDEFKILNKKFPMILFPAFHLQDVMQKRTLGARRWTKILQEKAKREKIEAYKATHDGELPPEFRKKGLFSCFGGKQ